MPAIMNHKIGRLLAIRLGPGEDLLRGILESCQKYDFQNAALLSGIPFVQCARPSRPMYHHPSSPWSFTSYFHPAIAIFGC